MPTPPLPDAIRALLAKPNPAVVATLRADGSPVTVATWYALEPGDRILLNMDRTRVRIGHLRRDPRLALTVLDEADWSNHLSFLGRIVEWRPDDGLNDIDCLSRRYTGQDHHDRESPRISARMEIDRWHGWGEPAWSERA